MALAPVLISCVSNETFYIVTSSKSHCPLEFIGQPCLTLEQYASHHRHDSSNVILMIESGNHSLQSSELRYSNRINGFIMNAKHPGAKIIFTISSNRIYAHYVQINDITFIGNFVRIELNYAQEVMITNCSFQGIRVTLREVNISRCTFSDYHGYYRTDNFIIVGQNGALSIDIYYNSATVKIIQSNFISNEVALYGQNYYSGAHVSLHIQECIFSNNTSKLKGGAVYLIGNRNGNCASILVIESKHVFQQYSGSKWWGHIC